jgi:hypothetical protein
MDVVMVRFGDIVPVTNTGMMMTVFLMLAGSCYLSMPLAVRAYIRQLETVALQLRCPQVAASTFYDVHRKFTKRKEDPMGGAGALALANDMAQKRKKDVEWKRRLMLVKGNPFLWWYYGLTHHVTSMAD